MRPPAQTHPFSAVPAVSLAINSTSLRGCRAGRCAAGVRGAGGLGKDVVGQQNPRALSVAAYWLPWPHPGIDLCCLLGQGGMAWPGSALRSVHSPPLPMILAVASVLTWFRHAPPPSQGFFWNRGARAFSERSNDRSPLPSPNPSPGKQTRCNETVWFPSAGQARRGVSPAIGRVAMGRRLEIGGAVPEIRRATRGNSPARWVSHSVYFRSPKQVSRHGCRWRFEMAAWAVSSRRYPALCR